VLRPTKNLNILPFETYDMMLVKSWFYSGDYPEFFRDMYALTEDQLKIYANMKDGQGFIVRHGDTPIGFIILYELRIVPANIKLSILIDKKYQEQGFGLEAMVEMCNYVFNRMRLEKLIVEVMESNKRIQQLLEMGGFEKEAVLKKEANINGDLQDVVRFALYKDQFKEVVKGLI